MTRTIINAILSHLVQLIDEEFLNTEPHLQDALLAEAQVLSIEIREWVLKKLETKGN